MAKKDSKGFEKRETVVMKKSDHIVRSSSVAADCGIEVSVLERMVKGGQIAPAPTRDAVGYCWNDADQARAKRAIPSVKTGAPSNPCDGSSPSQGRVS